MPLYQRSRLHTAVGLAAIGRRVLGPNAANAPKVTIAVIDSGICAVSDLTGRILPGWDFVENDAVPQDDYGHGCEVSGVIAANMNDGIGIAGVALTPRSCPCASWMRMRWLIFQRRRRDCIRGDNGAQVINMIWVVQAIFSFARRSYYAASKA